MPILDNVTAAAAAVWSLTPAAAWCLIGMALVHLLLLIVRPRLARPPVLPPPRLARPPELPSPRLARPPVLPPPRLARPPVLGLTDEFHPDFALVGDVLSNLTLPKDEDIALSSDGLSNLTLPKEPNKARKHEENKTKKRGSKAHRRGSAAAYSRATAANVNPKAQKKLNLVPAGLYRPDIHGMVKYEMKVLEFLEHGTTSLLGISGKRGMGKSTLLRLVHTSSRQDSSFHYVLFVEAGLGFTADTLQGVLARHIGLDPMPDFPTVNRISSFLRRASFIILLDDVRASFDLAAAGLPMPLGPRQKVVFTTRNESTCGEMGCAGNIIRMECLAEDVAWDLFRYNVLGDIIRPNSEIEDLAKKMVAECRGIPSAICTIGRSMAIQRDVTQWRVAYEMLKIKRPPLHEIEETDDEGYPRLDFFEDELGDPFLCTYRCPQDRSYHP